MKGQIIVVGIDYIGKDYNFSKMNYIPCNKENLRDTDTKLGYSVLSSSFKGNIIKDNNIPILKPIDCSYVTSEYDGKLLLKVASIIVDGKTIDLL